MPLHDMDVEQLIDISVAALATDTFNNESQSLLAEMDDLELKVKTWLDIDRTCRQQNSVDQTVAQYGEAYIKALLGDDLEIASEGFIAGITKAIVRLWEIIANLCKRFYEWLKSLFTQRRDNRENFVDDGSKHSLKYADATEKSYDVGKLAPAEYHIKQLKELYEFTGALLKIDPIHDPNFEAEYDRAVTKFDGPVNKKKLGGKLILLPKYVPPVRAKTTFVAHDVNWYAGLKSGDPQRFRKKLAENCTDMLRKINELEGYADNKQRELKSKATNTADIREGEAARSAIGRYIPICRAVLSIADSGRDAYIRDAKQLNAAVARAHKK